MTGQMNSTDTVTSKVNWKEIVIFFIVSTLVSAPFRLGWIPIQEWSLPFGLHIFFYILRGIGPLVGFLVMYYVLRSSVPRPNTLMGPYWKLTLISPVPLIVGLTIIGVPNSFSINENIFGLMYSTMLCMYALGEEYGWRGYLQQALMPLRSHWQILITAVIWYLWHLNFFVTGITISQHIIHFLALVAGSWGLWRVTAVSRSILFAAAVHLSFNLMGDVRGELNERLIVLAVGAVVWIILIRRMRSNEAFLAKTGVDEIDQKNG